MQMTQFNIFEIGICSCQHGDSVWDRFSGIYTVLSASFLNMILLFFKDYERSLRQLSLDDIERLAGRLLHPEGEGMDTSYMD